MIHSVQGDISRTAVLEKHRCSGSWCCPSEDWQIPAGCHVGMMLLLRRQLRKPHLTGVALNQYSSTPTPPPPCWPQREKGQAKKPPVSLYIS